ncbi:alpha/beta hydrolase [Streptomyces sp. JJ36]|uniref:alpha/beta hydrolase n=1 Tax=Streptomyces sp. JJ36 TaxID=2736645 RepID=UPI001F370662|nr:alpha/beta hydrolase [Streptomyces sp. JJ36]MCF6524745.1 hypothetical protein [Streptomyces sp. JJ36]
MPAPGVSASEAQGSTAWRALLTLAVAFVLLATTGWTAVKQDGAPGPFEAAVQAWEADGRIAGRALPGTDAPPQAVAGFFSSLSPAQRHRLAARHPLVVGNLGGAPVQLRYRANRLALAEARRTERRRMRSDRLTEAGRKHAARRMKRLSALLAEDRKILAFDPSGHGRAAEVFGDLAHARRVSVVVPGVDTELLTFEREDRAYSAPAGMAGALQNAQRAAAPAEPTATIAWADYSAPLGLGVDAASVPMAEAGAERLVGFVRALPGRSRVTLVCHSYGSVVCGVAADDLPRRVVDIAVAGSPGMRADDVTELGTDARVWAMRDGDDWIADVPHLEFGGLGHGADPVAAGFGARRLSAEGAAGHAGYFVPGTRSLHNLAAVGAGRMGTVLCAEGDTECATTDGRA